MSKPATAARAFTVDATQQGFEGERLGQRHDRLEREWIAMSVMSIRHSANRMAEDLNRRLGQVSVVVCRAGLAQISEDPKPFRSRFGILLRLDPGQVAKKLELAIGARATAIKHGLIGLQLSGPDAFQVSMHHAVHRSLKLLASFHAPIVEPAIP